VERLLEPALRLHSIWNGPLCLWHHQGWACGHGDQLSRRRSKARRRRLGL